MQAMLPDSHSDAAVMTGQPPAAAPDMSPDPLIAALQERVLDAARRGARLRIRGGGSKDFYGEPLSGDLLDVSSLAGVISYEPSELVVTVRAGTRLAELEALLVTQGQCLPFEPPHFGPAATVGGMVASGLSGPARASSGALRDYILGVKLLNGRGEVLTFGGQVMKNVAGYDVSRLLAGSLGTLGVLLEVSLKVLPIAPAEATVMFAGVGQQQALDLLNRWGGQPLPLSASCWVHDSTSTPARDFLFVRLRGAAAAVQAAAPRLMAEVKAEAQTAAGDAVLMDNGQAGADWAACREQTLPFFSDPPAAPASARGQALSLWRISVPQTAPAIDWPEAVGAPFIEWHGGLRWVWAPARAAAALRAAAERVGGNVTLFRHPARPLPAGFPVFTPLAPVLQRIQQQLQQQFDPDGVFNTKRLSI
jgi:glycolate oxidase FAD binding subunit